MAKKITNESFIDSDFLVPAIKRTKELIEVIDQLFDNLKEVGKESKTALEGLNPSSSVKDSNKLNEVLEKLLKTQQELTDLKEDRVKVDKTLKSLQEKKIKQDKEALQLAVQSKKVSQEQQKVLLQEGKVRQQNLKTAIISRKERERQFKEREKERNQRKKVLTEYQKESKRLNELRNRYKELAVAEKENTKEAKDLLKEVTKLDKKLKEIDDTVGQNQRSVGDYQSALEGLNSTIGKLGVVAAISKGIELLGSAFGDTREGALSLQIAFSKVSEGVKVFVQSVIASGPAVLGVFTAIGNSFKATVLEADILEKKIKKALTFGDTSKELGEEIKVLETELAALGETNVGDAIADGIEKVKKAFEGNVDVTSKAIEEQEKFLKLQLRTTIEISKQEKALAGLAEQRQILQDISDDDTLSFIERKKFIDLAQKAALEFAQLDNKLALTKEKLTIQAIKQDLRRAKALSESQIQAITTGEQLQKVLENEANARIISDANDEAFSAAFIERVDKQVEAEAFRRDQEEKNRITARDSFEEQIDIIQELGEQRIAVNQKVIASDESTAKERAEALQRNQALEKKIFDESVARIRKQGIASIELRDDLTKAEKDKRKALIETADIEKILNAESETEQLNLIRTIQLGEGETRVLKDLLKLKKDISEQNKEDEKVITETGLKEAELKKEIALQEQALNGEIKNLEDERLQDQKENLEKRLALLTGDSIKRLELEKKLNDLKLQEQETALEKEEEAVEKSAEKRTKAIEDAAELATKIIEINNAKRLKAIDDQLNAVEERQNSLRNAAENGNEEAVKSLAESEKREAEIRLAKEKELKRQQRIEAGLAAFQVFSANAQEDPKTALSKTIKDVSLLTAFIGALPSFFVGTEDTGKAGNSLDSNGGRLSILHDNERVMTAEQNKQLGGISNESLVQLATSPRQNFIDFNRNENDNQVTIVNSNQEELNRNIKVLISEVKKNKPIQTREEFNNRMGIVTQIVKTGNTIQRNHKKLFKGTRNN